MDFGPVEADHPVAGGQSASSADGKEEARGIEPVLGHLRPQARQVQPALLRVPGEGPGVDGQERFLVLARHEGPDPHTGRQPGVLRRVLRRVLPAASPASARSTASRICSNTRTRARPSRRAIAPAAGRSPYAQTAPCRSSAARTSSVPCPRAARPPDRPPPRPDRGRPPPRRRRLGSRRSTGRPDPADSSAAPSSRGNQSADPAATASSTCPDTAATPSTASSAGDQIAGYRAPAAAPRPHAAGTGRTGRRHAGVPADSSRSTVRDGGTIL